MNATAIMMGIALVGLFITIIYHSSRIIKWQVSVDTRLDGIEKRIYWQDTAFEVLFALLDIDDEEEKRDKITELLMKRIPMGNPAYKEESELERYYRQKLDEWGVAVKE